MIKEALDDFVLPRVWSHDRTKTIGSSEIGQCSRRIKYIKSEHQHDATYKQRWGATERGNLFENYLWEPALRKRYGANLLFAGKDQKTFIGEYLSATPDGLLIKQPRDVLKHLGIKDIGACGCIMIECKTIDPRVNLSEAKHVNIMQTQVQMGLMREKTKYKPNFAVLSYANASFMDDITEFPVEFDAGLYERVTGRAKRILEVSGAKELRPEGWIAGGKECDHCPFAKECGIERHNLPTAKWAGKPVDPQFRAEMTDMVRQAKAAQEARDAAEEKFREHQDSIKHRLREKDVRKIDGVVNWSSVKGRTVYDNEAIRTFAIEQGLDIEKFKDVGEATDRLTLGDV
jgi:hypothetical protein